MRVGVMHISCDEGRSTPLARRLVSCSMPPSVLMRLWSRSHSGVWPRTFVTRGPQTVECLMETHVSQSLVRMAVLSPVFQHNPKLTTHSQQFESSRVRLDGRSVDVHSDELAVSPSS